MVPAVAGGGGTLGTQELLNLGRALKGNTAITKVLPRASPRARGSALLTSRVPTGRNRPRPAIRPSRAAQITMQSKGVGDAGIAALADALGPESGLALLHAMRNDIGLGGAQALGRMLERAAEGSLIELNLSGNKFGEEGAAAARLLPLCRQLPALLMSRAIPSLPPLLPPLLPHRCQDLELGI